MFNLINFKFKQLAAYTLAGKLNENIAPLSLLFSAHILPP